MEEWNFYKLHSVVQWTIRKISTSIVNLRNTYESSREIRVVIFQTCQELEQCEEENDIWDEDGNTVLFSYKEILSMITQENSLIPGE